MDCYSDYRECETVYSISETLSTSVFYPVVKSETEYNRNHGVGDVIVPFFVKLRDLN